MGKKQLIFSAATILAGVSNGVAASNGLDSDQIQPAANFEQGLRCQRRKPPRVKCTTLNEALSLRKAKLGSDENSVNDPKPSNKEEAEPAIQRSDSVSDLAALFDSKIQKQNNQEKCAPIRRTMRTANDWVRVQQENDVKNTEKLGGCPELIERIKVLGPSKEHRVAEVLAAYLMAQMPSVIDWNLGDFIEDAEKVVKAELCDIPNAAATLYGKVLEDATNSYTDNLTIEHFYDSSFEKEFYQYMDDYVKAIKAKQCRSLNRTDLPKVRQGGSPSNVIADTTDSAQSSKDRDEAQSNVRHAQDTKDASSRRSSPSEESAKTAKEDLMSDSDTPDRSSASRHSNSNSRDNSNDNAGDTQSPASKNDDTSPAPTSARKTSNSRQRTSTSRQRTSNSRDRSSNVQGSNGGDTTPEDNLRSPVSQRRGRRSNSRDNSDNSQDNSDDNSAESSIAEVNTQSPAPKNDDTSLVASSGSKTSNRRQRTSNSRQRTSNSRDRSSNVQGSNGGDTTPEDKLRSRVSQRRGRRSNSRDNSDNSQDNSDDNSAESSIAEANTQSPAPKNDDTSLVASSGSKTSNRRQRTSNSRQRTSNSRQRTSNSRDRSSNVQGSNGGDTTPEDNLRSPVSQRRGRRSNSRDNSDNSQDNSDDNSAESCIAEVDTQSPAPKNDDTSLVARSGRKNSNSRDESSNVQGSNSDDKRLKNDDALYAHRNSNSRDRNGEDRLSIPNDRLPSPAPRKRTSYVTGEIERLNSVQQHDAALPVVSSRRENSNRQHRNSNGQDRNSEDSALSTPENNPQSLAPQPKSRRSNSRNSNSRGNHEHSSPELSTKDKFSSGGYPPLRIDNPADEFSGWNKATYSDVVRLGKSMVAAEDDDFNKIVAQVGKLRTRRLGNVVDAPAGADC